jgi:hypothetical protein
MAAMVNQINENNCPTVTMGRMNLQHAQWTRIHQK